MVDEFATRKRFLYRFQRRESSGARGSGILGKGQRLPRRSFDRGELLDRRWTFNNLPTFLASSNACIRAHLAPFSRDALTRVSLTLLERVVKRSPALLCIWRVSRRRARSSGSKFRPRLVAMRSPRLVAAKRSNYTIHARDATLRWHSFLPCFNFCRTVRLVPRWLYANRAYVYGNIAAKGSEIRSSVSRPKDQLYLRMHRP